MAKKSRTRKYYKKGNWSTRLSNVSGSQLATAGNQFIISYNLAQNAAQDDNTISQKYTVKNIYAQLEMESDNAVLTENLQAYIMFVPQGHISGTTQSAYASLPFDHPEWIMAYRYFGSAQLDTNSNSANYYPPLRLRTRLARKLDTGDRVVLVILGQNAGASQSATLSYRGLVRMNVKAN